MFENLLKLIQENAGEAIINNPAIPNSKNNAAIQTATKSLLKNLQVTAKSGGLDSIKELFNNGENVATNPVMNNLTSGVASDLMKKFGLDKGAASGIVSMLIPIVMSKLVNKTNDPNDNSFNLPGIIGALTGNQAKTGGLLGTLKGMLGR